MFDNLMRWDETDKLHYEQIEKNFNILTIFFKT